MTSHFATQANVQKISNSPQRAKRFKECCKFKDLKSIKIKLDVKTRWDSGYLMMSQAVYLRKAIDQFIDDADDNEHLYLYKLSSDEWNMCEILITILMPFKQASQTLQQGTRPSIDEVFYTYESLFNKIDQLKATFMLPRYLKKDWVNALHVAVDAMSAKLGKHYDHTDQPFVYPEGVILEPCGKLALFEQELFPGHNMAQKYKDACRKRYVDDYELAVQAIDEESEDPSLPLSKGKFSEHAYYGGY